VPLALACLLAPTLLWQGGVRRLHLAEAVAAPLALLGGALLGLAGYVFYVRRVELRPVAELSLPRAGRELAAGTALGTALFGTTIGVLTMAGAFRFTGLGPASAMLVPLCLAVFSGVLEELMFRGIVFRLIERSWGTWVALACSSILFGLVHLSNPHPTLTGAVSIIFEAGILLAAAYVLTRRLWLAMGLHAAWNFTQGGIFSIPVSGNPSAGWVQGQLSGPDWLSGGGFGAEASVVALATCTLAGLLLLRAAHARGRFLTWAGQRAIARG
jgi:membrane protease YdiL (CAAX protease family)